MTTVRKVASEVSTAAFAAGLVFGALPAIAHADGHQVTYTITATGNLTGQVRYMTSDPPNQAAFNNNSSQFMTTTQAAFSAGQPLVYNNADALQPSLVAANRELHTEILQLLRQ